MNTSLTLQCYLSGAYRYHLGSQFKISGAQTIIELYSYLRSKQDLKRSLENEVFLMFRNSLRKTSDFVILGKYRTKTRLN